MKKGLTLTVIGNRNRQVRKEYDEGRDGARGKAERSGNLTTTTGLDAHKFLLASFVQYVIY